MSGVFRLRTVRARLLLLAIGAASTAGAGSTFWVELPFPRIADAAPAPAADAAPARRAEEPPA